MKRARVDLVSNQTGAGFLPSLPPENVAKGFAYVKMKDSRKKKVYRMKSHYTLFNSTFKSQRATKL